jgi:hypothetical protein
MLVSRVQQDVIAGVAYFAGVSRSFTYENNKAHTMNARRADPDAGRLHSVQGSNYRLQQQVREPGCVQGQGRHHRAGLRSEPELTVGVLSRIAAQTEPPIPEVHSTVHGNLGVGRDPDLIASAGVWTVPRPEGNTSPAFRYFV